MLCLFEECTSLFEERASEVRFGTEKSIGFPRLTAIFDDAVTRDSYQCGSGGWGAIPRIIVGLAKC
jgi:hypothetical protein